MIQSVLAGSSFVVIVLPAPTSAAILPPPALGVSRLSLSSLSRCVCVRDQDQRVFARVQLNRSPHFAPFLPQVQPIEAPQQRLMMQLISPPSCSATPHEFDASAAGAGYCCRCGRPLRDESELELPYVNCSASAAAVVAWWAYPFLLACDVLCSGRFYCE